MFATYARLRFSLLVLFAAAFACPLQALTPDPAPVIPAVPTEAEAPIALLVDLGSGQVLHAYNPDRRFMPASVTKVMTLYLAFELIAAKRLDPAQVFTMSPTIARDWHRTGSTMFLVEGERVRVDDLLLGIANVSANDGAAVLAEGQAGSLAGWTAAMNQTARGLRMTGSHFESPNGWPDEGRTFTTANDLALLARAMITRHPDKLGYYIGRAGFDYKGIAQINHDPMRAGARRGRDQDRVHQRGRLFLSRHRAAQWATPRAGAGRGREWSPPGPACARLCRVGLCRLRAQAAAPERSGGG
ncbi:MAG: D-alanyl-D-alanine carboxypeptidase family protein [Erythrobacter sp.]